METATHVRSGFLLADKPSGPTSYDIIRWLKRSLPGVKLGHSGTLDPLASGLLIVLLGKATKRQSFFMKMDKEYRFTMRLGIQTDTGDITGRVLKTLEPPTLDEDLIRKDLIPRFLGIQKQKPPLYSAIKFQGVPLYKWARKGHVIDRPDRSIHIHSLTLLAVLNPVDIEFRVRCSSGTYIRSLVEDMGRAMASIATVVSITRESIGPFRVDEAIPAHSLRDRQEDEIWSFVREMEEIS
ncbi:MAG: tRNA pseudouridine(55) synthase TruB [Elusimicrobia bacterium]|nr:tRNA pseudouridine(55) synthase TruB [Candidatus Obscuribacterium magneticum]